jgi:hypothetical protein
VEATETTAPTTSKPTTASPTTEASSKPSIEKSERPTIADTAAETEKPTVEKSERPTIADTAAETEKPTVEKSERPTIADTAAPTVSKDDGLIPVITKSSVPTPVAVTEHPTFVPTEDTAAPSPVTGTDTGGAETPTGGDGMEETAVPADNSTFTLIGILLGIVAVFLLYRRFCKTAAPAAASTATGGNYSRLPTSEESRGFLDPAGDIEMSGGVHTAAYDGK